MVSPLNVKVVAGAAALIVGIFGGAHLGWWNEPERTASCGGFDDAFSSGGTERSTDPDYAEDRDESTGSRATAPARAAQAPREACETPVAPRLGTATGFSQ